MEGIVQWEPMLYAMYATRCHHYSRFMLCWTSLVSTPGDTVISKFFAYSAAACTKWSIDTFKASSGELYKTKDNNYSFYQVHLPQNNMVTPLPKEFE